MLMAIPLLVALFVLDFVLQGALVLFDFFGVVFLD
jgi:hypothetical protein